MPSGSNPEHSSLEIKLQRVDRIYRPGETVQGSVVVAAKDGWSHQGLELQVTGQVRLQQSLASGSMNGFDSVKNLQPVVMLDKRLSIKAAGRFDRGTSEVPFSFELPGERLYETYHGVYISVTYELVASVERGGLMARPLEDSKEFIVEVPEPAREEAEPEPFEITPANLENVATATSIPKFSIKGRLFHKTCPINLPFTGEVTIQESEVPIKSIELQLVRVETVCDAAAGKTAKESTEIQNIQIGDGDVCRNIVIPMYMIFPRLFTCPTMKTKTFTVEFEVNLQVIFADGYMVTEGFEIDLYRGR